MLVNCFLLSSPVIDANENFRFIQKNLKGEFEVGGWIKGGLNFQNFPKKGGFKCYS